MSTRTATRTKDFRIVAVVVNNQLRERREAILVGGMSGGPITRAELARRIGVTQMDYGDYEALKKSPIDRRRHRLGRWLPSALKVARFYGVEPEVLWPEQVRAVRAKMVERRLDAEEVHALCSAPDADATTPFGLLTSGEEVAAVRAAVDALPTQQATVIRARFGMGDEPPKTLVEIAEDLHLSCERVRQVEAGALRRLRGAVPSPTE